MKRFYVKDFSRLEEFGFHKTTNEYWLYSRRSLSAIVNCDSHILSFQSPCIDCIATICEMYKQGVVIIIEDGEKATYNIKVTEEEMKLIYERRNSK